MDTEFSDRNPALGELFGAHFDTIRERHDRALERAGASCAVIFSGSARTAFLDDRSYPFVANPHFLGWVPRQDLPMSYVFYKRGETPILVCYQPRDYWHVVPGAPDGYWTDHFDIRIVHEPDAAASHLPDVPERCIGIGELDTPAGTLGIERMNPTVALNSLHYARARKTDYELACMRLASRRAVLGHRAAEAAFRAGAAEFDIHRAYCAAVRQTDNELPYGNIIALNEHGAVLHYTDLERDAPANPESFLIDAGASVNGYAADITRTYTGTDAKFGELIGSVDQLQRNIIAQIRPGVAYTDLHLQAHSLLAALLVDVGLARGQADALIATGVTSAFFPHGLGHLLGLQVHDVGGHMQDEAGTMADPPSGHRFLRLTRTLEEGMTLTVEPGLYAIDLLLDSLRGTPAEAHVCWDEVDWLRPLGGIRIEDNIAVTSDGCENLTRDAFAAAA